MNCVGVIIICSITAIAAIVLTLQLHRASRAGRKAALPLSSKEAGHLYDSTFEAITAARKIVDDLTLEDVRKDVTKVLTILYELQDGMRKIIENY